MLQYMMKTASKWQKRGIRSQRQLILCASIFVACSLALSTFPNTAHAQATEPWPGALNAGLFVVIVQNDTVDFVAIDTIAIREFLFRLAGRDDTTVTSSGGAGGDSLLVVSINRHDWHIYGKKVFHALLRADSIHIGIFDTTLPYGALAIRVQDTTRGNPAFWLMDSGLRGTLLQVRKDGIVHMPDNSAARAYMSTTQNTTASTDTQLDFASESYDKRDEFDLTTDSFHATADGLYLVQAQVNISNAAAQDNCVAVLYKNGFAYVNGTVATSSNTGFNQWATSSISCTLQLSAGDELELYMFTPLASAIESGQGISYLEIIKLH